MMNSPDPKVFVICAFLFSSVLQGCGGGHHDASPSTLTGTAAIGAPIANAVVTVKDRNGSSKTGTTDAHGKYNIDVTGLTAPFLLKVDPTSRSSLYSIGTQAGNVNIHPFTDLIIGSWYLIKGLEVSDAFAAMGSSTPVPTQPEVSTLAIIAKDIIQRWLTDQGLNPQTFDLITTPFDANGTGFDAVLALSQIDANATVTIQDSTTNQTSTLSFDSSASTLTVNTTTTTGPQVSVDTTTAVIPTTLAFQTAVNGVNATLSHVVGVANTAGLFLADTDLSGFFDDNYLQDGFGKDIGTAEYAALLRGVGLNLSSFTIDRIVSYDDPNKVIQVIATFSWTQNGETQYGVVDKGGDGIGFKQQADGSWRFFGNQRIADVQARAMTLQVMAGDPTDGAVQLLQLQVITPEGSVISAQANGGSTISTLTKSSTVFLDALYPTVNSPVSVPKDVFGASLPVSPIGTPYAFTLTTSTGEVSYTDVLQATTTESIQITNLSGHTLNDAELGQPLAVNWTLPASFPIGRVDLVGQVTAGGTACSTYAQFSGPSATSGTITLPATCGGVPVVSGVTPDGSDPVILKVMVRGVNGEETLVEYHFR